MPTICVRFELDTKLKTTQPGDLREETTILGRVRNCGSVYFTKNLRGKKIDVWWFFRGKELCPKLPANLSMLSVIHLTSTTSTSSQLSCMDHPPSVTPAERKAMLNMPKRQTTYRCKDTPNESLAWYLKSCQRGPDWWMLHFVFDKPTETPKRDSVPNGCPRFLLQLIPGLPKSAYYYAWKISINTGEITAERIYGLVHCTTRGETSEFLCDFTLPLSPLPQAATRILLPARWVLPPESSSNKTKVAIEPWKNMFQILVRISEIVPNPYVGVLDCKQCISLP